MLLVYQTLLVLLFPYSYTLATNNTLRPKFNPYCSLKIKCKSICICEVHPNCSLLPMDETTRNSILYYHNQIRDIQSTGEPQAAGLTILEYDNELEMISNCWAGRCSNEYSDCFMTPKFNETSQSVVQFILEGGETPSTFLWMHMMSYWLKQASSISVESFNSLPIGKKYEFVHNFAQVMSDQILYIGCAWSITDNLLTFVCTYGPRGPNPTERIYKIGNYCSMCPENYNCDNLKPFKRLCKRKKEITVKKVQVTTMSSTTRERTRSPSTRSTGKTTEKISIIPSYKSGGDYIDHTVKEKSSSESMKIDTPITTISETPTSALTSAPTITSTTATITSTTISYLTQPMLPPSFQSTYQNERNDYHIFFLTTSPPDIPPFLQTFPHQIDKPSLFDPRVLEESYHTTPKKSHNFIYWDSQQPNLNTEPASPQKRPLLPKPHLPKVITTLSSLYFPTKKYHEYSEPGSVYRVLPLPPPLPPPPQFERDSGVSKPLYPPPQPPTHLEPISPQGALTYSPSPITNDMVKPGLTTPCSFDKNTGVLKPLYPPPQPPTHLEPIPPQGALTYSPSPITNDMVKPSLTPPTTFDKNTGFSKPFNPSPQPPTQGDLTHSPSPITYFPPPSPITYFPPITHDMIEPSPTPFTSQQPPISREPVLPQGSSTYSPSLITVDIVEPSSTPVTDDLGKKKSGGNADSDSKEEENSTLPLVTFLCVGLVFLIVGLGLFFLIMYTLRMTTICA